MKAEKKNGKEGDGDRMRRDGALDAVKSRFGNNSEYFFRKNLVLLRNMNCIARTYLKTS